MTKQPKWSIKFDSGEERTPEVFQMYMQEQRYLDEPVANPESFTIELKNHSPVLETLISFAFCVQINTTAFNESAHHAITLHALPQRRDTWFGALGNNEHTD